MKVAPIGVKGGSFVSLTQRDCACFLHLPLHCFGLGRPPAVLVGYVFISCYYGLRNHGAQQAKLDVTPISDVVAWIDEGS